MVKNGSKEITLLGQNVNAYNFKEKKLSSLIYELEKIDELKRIRYTTSHPNDMTDDLIETYSRSKKLMPFYIYQFKLVQINYFKLMNRKHDKDFYLNIVSN